MKSYLVVIMLMLTCYWQNLNAQNQVVQIDTLDHEQENAHQFSTKKLIIPSVLISYGFLSLISEPLKELNGSTRYEINEHQPDKIVLDNYTQYAPAIAVYGLNLFGLKGRHNFRDRTLIYATSQVIVTAIVLPLKHIIKEERPDGSNRLSFPSGHTSTAFSSAQFLFREYQQQNFLLSLCGYPIAIFTGVYRTLNDKHWVGDVVAGAGIGILSTEAAYWLFPKINGWVQGKKDPNASIVYPYYQSGAIGLGLMKRF
ncbi:phosphatase PAP2 family protein [Pedobacter sp. ASV28]|uniref:phosphatase PAP2 family protein n=1 Tax=Pedobacter sp. ASV28 TaxID=2795123 RepID=UPI001E57CAA9|nr:phosphatase PAP2 family protein [Pedobacter sp. ASV28]